MSYKQLKKNFEVFKWDYEKLKTFFEDTVAEDGSRFELDAPIEYESAEIKMSDLFQRIDDQILTTQKIIDSFPSNAISYLAIIDVLERHYQNYNQTLNDFFSLFPHQPGGGKIKKIDSLGFYFLSEQKVDNSLQFLPLVKNCSELSRLFTQVGITSVPNVEKIYEVLQDTKEKKQKIDTDYNFIQRKLKPAENLLVKATSEGLSGVFRQRTGALKWRLIFTKIYFLLALGVLISLLFILYFAPDNWTFLPETLRNFKKNSSWGGVATKVSLLVPFIWLIQFIGREYANLFKLKEHYEHKYLIALSLNNFQEQAPGYENAMSFLVFHELSLNPADAINGKSTDSNQQKQAYDISKQILDKVTKKD